MHDELLPLFPLEVVLLPQNYLPLHIFEDRYKEMIGEAIERRREFGVVMAAEGGIVNTGCTASIERVLKQYPDGRYDLITVGRRRFVIHALDEERSFLRGDVEYFDDDDPVAPSELCSEAISVAGMALGDGAGSEPQEGGPVLSFNLARSVQDRHFRQQLLMCRSESDRLRQLIQFFPKQKIRDDYSAKMKTLAARNGHGKMGPVEPS
jgi:hypothetical protein